MTSLLSTINDPADLRRLPRHQLKTLAGELREFVIDSVARTGGHLSSNLGTVELTIALHYVFNTPHDRLVWDVGHQTYPHKILTGRRDRMGSLRQLGGLSGFPQRAESEYDTFGTAHSSTSISAALGMALAAQRKGENRHAVAIIGDGAMTAGMAFEALNNAGVADANLLVILNDNDMSISPPVGALNKYLARLMSGNFYEAARQGAKAMLKNAPPLFELARRFEEHAKGMVVPGTIFEEFGFNYVGPIDGHDLDALIPTLENLKAKRGPQFLHVVTKKGYGYKLAENDPINYHGPGKFDPTVGITQPSAPPKLTFTQVFGQWLCDMAEADKRLIAITPAMREGSGMVEFHKRFPERYFDVGIAEQHAVTFAAGLACEGLKPVVAIYSTFLQRGYDQLIHDVALQNLPVVFALDRAGLVGADGATHCGAPSGVALSADDAYAYVLCRSTGDLAIVRLDGYRNLVRDPRIGLLFMIPGIDETLRINGSAQLSTRGEWLDLCTNERRRPTLVIAVSVQEAYLHCAKAFLRSKLWKPEAQVDRSLMPSAGRMISDQTGIVVADESREDMERRYAPDL